MNEGSRYFSWLDIVTVHDRKSDENQIKIVQRLTDDDEMGDAREWKIITISPDGSVTEEKMTYAERSKNALGVKLVNFYEYRIDGNGPSHGYFKRLS